MSDSEKPPRPDGLAEEAALWAIRMSGPEPERHRQAFEAWLERGALHRPGFERAARAYDATARLGRPRRPRSLHMALAAGAAAMFLGLTPFINQPGGREHEPVVRERAGLRQIVGVDTARLADGSTALVEHRARLASEFTPLERRVRVFAGHVRFHVIAEGRPFVVLTNRLRIRARGTVFDVVVGRDGATLVHLIEGAVEVTSVMRRGVFVDLAPGQRASSRDGMIDPVSETVATAPGWPTAIGTFDETPLADVLAQANRLAGNRVLHASPQSAGRRVSGIVAIGDPSRLAADLAQLLDLDVSVAPDRSLLLRPGRNENLRPRN